jgi:hypothetical protein
VELKIEARDSPSDLEVSHVPGRNYVATFFTGCSVWFRGALSESTGIGPAGLGHVILQQALGGGVEAYLRYSVHQVGYLDIPPCRGPPKAAGQIHQIREHNGFSTYVIV